MAFFTFDKTAYTSAAAPNNSAVNEMVAIDLDGDLDLDLISARFFFPLQDATIPIEVLQNDGTGTFTDGSALLNGSAPVTSQAREMVVADFNGDNKYDLFIADHGFDAEPFPGFQNQLLLSSPTGYVNATAASVPAISDFSHSATAADVDHDGDIDLLVGNIFRAPPYVLLNDGDGVFTRVNKRLPSANTNLDKNDYTTTALGDFNNDSRPDLFLGGDIDSSSVVLRNDGTGKFVAVKPKLPPKPFGIKTITLDSHVLDINNDGRQDIVTVSTRGNPFYTDHAVQILINRGGFKFANESAARIEQFEGAGWIRYLHFADLNGDGALDIVTEPSGGGTAAEIRINDGDGFFFKPLNASISLTGQAIEVGDFNGDTIPDILAWGGTHGDVLLLYKGLDEQNYPLDGDNNDNTLHGDALANSMSGGDGVDTISAGAGGDSVNGDDGTDTLNGGSGDDTINGGNGRDVMTGGSGADDFVFNLASDTGNDPLTRDIINDFRHLEDDVDVSSIADFVWRGKAVFTATEPELRYVTSNPKGTSRDKTVIQGDVDGDGHVDFQIQLKGLIKLTVDDLIL